METSSMMLIAVCLLASIYSTLGQGCYPSPCGVNAKCHQSFAGIAVCSCPAGYTGDPERFCVRDECLDHTECPNHLSCRNGKCVNPCRYGGTTCGFGAECIVRNHVPVCTCPPSYRGDPFKSCRPADPDEACHIGGRWGPCGENTKCQVVNGVAVCSCLRGYFGSPATGCRHECELDSDCSPQQYCSENKCKSACSQCGIGADCVNVANHRPICKCPKNYFGNPLVECRAECYGDVDCPAGRPACFYGICKNPCDGACGINANCNLRGLTPVCSCPRDMTGNPFESCRPFTPEDLCTPNICGENAKCTPGHDKTGAERPVCSCYPGYIGNPLVRCNRGECQSDSECSDGRACVNYSCVDPCSYANCAINANCEARRHVAVCKCAPGYYGDALSSCQRQARNYGHGYYKKK